MVFEIWTILYSKLVNFRWILSSKLTITQKLKIAKIGKLIFHSFQHIRHLSWKLDHFRGRGWGLHILSWETSRLSFFWPFLSVQDQNPIFFSEVVKFTWKIRNRLNQKKNQISDFYFSSYAEKQWGRQFFECQLARACSA